MNSPTARKAVLVGTTYDPEIELSFGYDDQHPDGRYLRDWVKKLPDVRWQRASKVWRLLDPEMLPPGELKRAGFIVVRPDGRPAKRSDTGFSGMGLSGMGLSGTGLPLVMRTPPESDTDDLEIPAWFGLDLMDYQVIGAKRAAAGHYAICDRPGLGKTRVALAAAAILGAKRTLILCPPVVATHWRREVTQSGLGVQRDAVSRDAVSRDAAGLTPPSPALQAPMGGVRPASSIMSRPGSPSQHVVQFKTGRKEPELPDTGVVIVPDSLVTARTALVTKLAAWTPDVMIYDETHRAMTWTSARSRVGRQLARSSGKVFPVTGTPMFAKTVQLAPMLDMTGQLDSVFGGRRAFYADYAKRNHFGEWAPVKKRLPELRRILDEKVWVCRTMEEVNLSLPELSRFAKWIDVDQTEYQVHYADIVGKIDSWLDQFHQEYGREPDEEEIETWADGNFGMISLLRKAAGLAKVGPAAEMVAEWVEANAEVDSGADGRGAPGAGSATPRCSRPLVVWTHHRVVTEAMAAAVPAHLGRVGVIQGGISDARRDELVDAFQRGEIAVLVCQIVAAGVGITLTRSSDALFVETDWTPDLITQAEARLRRIGQTSHVRCTTLVAAGTLDERIHEVLGKKIELLDLILPGGDNKVSVNRGPANRGPANRGPANRGPANRGPANRVAAHKFAEPTSPPTLDEVKNASRVSARRILADLAKERIRMAASQALAA